MNTSTATRSFDRLLHSRCDRWGICRRCKCPKEESRASKTRCANCSEERKNAKQLIYRQRIDNGCCYRCNSPDCEAKICFTCWLKQKACYWYNKQAYWVRLEMIWIAQGGRCALSSEPLLYGVNAHLDHILPRSRGGLTEFSNLQFLTSKVNWAKASLTNAEFIDLCQKIGGVSSRS